MKLYESVAVASLVVVSFAFGVFSRIHGVNPILSILIVLLAFFLTTVATRVYPRIEASGIRTATRRMLIMGRGIPPSFVRRQILLLEVSVIGVIVLSLYTLMITSVGKFDPMAVIYVAIPATMVVASLVALRLKMRLTVSFRKTSVEVELPFLLSFMWALSESHITLYDLFNMIEQSVSLKAWSKEVSFAKRLAAVTNSSLMQAVATISDTHPSPVVRGIFKRIVSIGYITGSARNVVKKAFRYTYEQLHDRLNRLTERLDIINGVILFGFLFLPIILATVSPLTGQGATEVFAITLIVEIPITLVMYAFISHIYPSGFVLSTPKSLVLVSAASVAMFVAFVMVYALPAVLYSPTNVWANPTVSTGMSEALLYPLLISSLIPGCVLSELWYRRTRVYSTLSRLIADAVEASYSTGENFVATLERLSSKESKSVQRLVKMIAEGYSSDVLRRVVVVNAPSLFYATFIETTLFSLLVGADPRTLTTIVNSFESMGRVVERISRVSKTLETLVVVLSASLGFFIKYLEKIFTGFMELVLSMGREFHMAKAVFTVFQFNPSVFVAITATSLLAIVTVSLFVGKTRGGSMVYGFRSALLSVTCFIASGAVVGAIVPALT